MGGLVGREQRAKDRKRLRRVREEVRPEPAPQGQTFQVMVCECGGVWRYGRGAWVPFNVWEEIPGDTHTHVLTLADMTI